MAINVIDTLKAGPSGHFPVVVVEEVQGGFRAVATTGIRDNIPISIRSSGMLVHSIADEKDYRLVDGITNTDWVEVTGADAGLDATGPTGYLHTQSIAASSWVINHGLGYDPNINILGTGNITIDGLITYPSGGSVLLVEFNSNFVGTGFLT